VNAASSLIQTSAHEDANIIFGAVLDEKMHEEVKITVIATGFRDQMPERRARMLNVEEAPIVSVPVVAADSWMREAAPEIVSRPAPPRFMSQEEPAASEPIFFASTAPAVATTITVAAPLRAESATDPAPSATPERMRDYAGDFAPSALPASDPMEPAAPAVPAAFVESPSEPERDLDVPAFLRRLKF
jgi:cell division protein FtsZ